MNFNNSFFVLFTNLFCLNKENVKKSANDLHFACYEFIYIARCNYYIKYTLKSVSIPC